MTALKPFTCEICHEDCYGKRCRSCRNWQRYWDSLTEEQQRAELKMMDDHANEPRNA